MARSRLSRPLATALSDQLLSPTQRIFDYGSGRGDDVRHLRAAGFVADGWDPVHRPGTDRAAADVVPIITGGHAPRAQRKPPDTEVAVGSRS